MFADSEWLFLSSPVRYLRKFPQIPLSSIVKVHNSIWYTSSSISSHCSSITQCVREKRSTSQPGHLWIPIRVARVCRGCLLKVCIHLTPQQDTSQWPNRCDPVACLYLRRMPWNQMAVWFLLRYPRQKRASYRRTWTCIYTGNSAKCHCFWDTASAMYHDRLQGCISVSRDILQSTNEQLMEHCLARNVPAGDNRKNFPLSSNLIGSKHQWSTPRSLPRANKKQGGSCGAIFTHARF